eukprot:4444892-Amphidinium_carterae.2
MHPRTTSKAGVFQTLRGGFIVSPGTPMTRLDHLTPPPSLWHLHTKRSRQALRAVLTVSLLWRTRI